MFPVLVEFLGVLCKVLWFTALGFLKLFLPVQKKDVSKEIVLITGAGSGLGRLMALRFAELGATVVLWDINKEANDAVTQEITAKSQTAYAYQCDCSKRENIYQTATKVKQDVGEVTVLVNNAGIVSGKKFFDVSDDMADLTFKVNTAAHFWTIKAFVPDMMKKNRGHIITVASAAGLFGVAGLMDYCASKFGAVGIHEALSSDLSALKLDGVQTTCICPFYISTGMFDGVKSRFNWLLPIVTPEYALKKIMQAFHGNQNYLIMPRIVILFNILKSVLPTSAMLEAGHFFGVNSSMDTYVGRKKKEYVHGDSDSRTYPTQCSSLRKGGSVILKGHPCKLVEILTSVPGKHGHAKLHLVGLDLFTAKRYEDIHPASHKLQVPLVSRTDYQLVDINDGFLGLLDDDGGLREDINLPQDQKLADTIKELFESGQEVTITILQALSEEAVVAARRSKHYAKQ